MTYLRRIEDRLASIAAENRLRRVETWQPRDLADFSSNDYLALSTDPQVVAALQRATRAGAGGARLLGGRHREHSLLEEELASWLGRERALVFSSGYLAALGAIAVLGSVSEAVYSDALNHASLIDGIRATGLPREVFPHGQLPERSSRRARALIVSESLFSMDGDLADVEALLHDLDDDDILLLDEAHALGVLGPEGAGLARGLDDSRIVILGTLSKALGGLGGFIAGPERAIELMINTARTFIFDTALPPALALAGRVAVAIARKADDRRALLRSNAECLHAGLRDGGIEAAPRLRASRFARDDDALRVARDDGALRFATEASPIVPIVLGSEERALHVAAALLEKKIYVPAIRPPTVPAGSSRLRVSLRSDHTDEQIDALVRELKRCIATS